MKAIIIDQPGGPEVLRLAERETPRPGAGEVLVRIEAAGVNFIDVYQREGRYPLPLPFVPGREGAGVVEAVGEGVSAPREGERVAWATTSGQGSYATHAVLPAERLIVVPEGLGAEAAAAAMLQGMTAHFLSEATFPIQQGHVALVHAGAGGVGLLLTQLAVRRGARVITTVSTAEKAKLSSEAGASEVILYTEEDFAERVRALTSGRGVDVVYDSVGKTTFEKGLGVLRRRGTMVLFGASSGAVAPLDPMVLNQRGSLFLTRPSLFHYTAARAELEHHAHAVLGLVRRGELKLRIDRSHPLAEAARAHEDLERRRTTGKTLLIP